VTGAALELAPLGGIDEAKDDWSRLAAASGNPFATVEWFETWLRHADVRFEPRLFAALEPGGRVVAIVPLALARGRYVRKARFLGAQVANEGGAICAPADRELGINALHLALAATRGEWDVFLGENLPGADWATRLRGALVARKGSPVVRGPWASWDAFLQTRSRTFRKEVRRKERRLQKRGMELRTVATEEELGPALDDLFELHRRRWGARAAPSFVGQEPFHRAFAQVALELGWARLRLMVLDGQTVAATYSFRFGNAEWSYQVGRSPELEHESLGLVATAIEVREAFAEGAAEFRLGPGAQPYKLRFATGDPGLETVGIPRGLRGRASLLAARRRAAPRH
jgi:CelD/BcsL family acetyltransferase involved in cellulose biosynthesis